MTPDEHVTAADSTAIRGPGRALPVVEEPAVSDHSFNPFRLLVPRTSRWRKLGDYLTQGGHIGAVLFWLVGMAISIWLLIITPERTWVDWLLRPICFPAVLAMLGELVGALVGLFAWFGYVIFHVHE